MFARSYMKLKTVHSGAPHHGAPGGCCVAEGTNEGHPSRSGTDHLQVPRVSHNPLIGQELIYSLIVGRPWK